MMLLPEGDNIVIPPTPAAAAEAPPRGLKRKKNFKRREKKKMRHLEKQKEEKEKEEKEINNNPEEDISMSVPAEEVPADPEMNDKLKYYVDKETWDTMTKSQRRNRIKKEKEKERKSSGKNGRSLSNKKKSSLIPAEKPSSREIQYPFEIDPQDHCETPEIAHQHISHFLTYLAKEVLGKEDISQLCIYDPFYCEGRVITNFSNLGFTNVLNPIEDFYSVHQSGQLPEFDVIVTNPPYSRDHIERFIKFCVSTGKPWFLLLPNYVYIKDYYGSVLVPEGKIVPQRVFYIVPEQRYLFWTPKGRHQAKSKDKTSPFITFWYCHFGEKLAQAFTWFTHQPKQNCVIAKQTVDLPVRVLDPNDPRAKKVKNSKKRKKIN